MEQVHKYQTKWRQTFTSYYDWRKKKNCKNCAKRETSDVTVVLTRLFPPPPSLASCSSSSLHLCLNICVFLSCLCQSQEKHFLLHERKFFFASPPPIDFLLATSVSVFTSSDWCVCVRYVKACDLTRMKQR